MATLLPKEFPLSNFIEERENQRAMLNTFPAFDFLTELKRADQWPESWPTEFDDVGRQLRDLLQDTARALYAVDTNESPSGTFNGIALQDLRLVFADPATEELLIQNNKTRVSLGLSAICMFVLVYEKRVTH